MGVLKVYQISTGCVQRGNFVTVAEKVFTINIDGYIGPEDFFSFMEPSMPAFSVADLEFLIASMPTDTEVVDVKINSGGGSVSEGFALYDRLATIPQTVNTIVLGQCGSIATVVAQAGKKGKRKAYQNSKYFVHNPAWPSDGSSITAKQAKKLYDELKVAEEDILDFYVNATGSKRSELRNLMDAETTMSMAEAKRKGFIDEIIDTDISNQKVYKIAAFASKPEIKSQDMSVAKELKEQFASLENVIAKGFQALKFNIKNAMSKTDDGKTIYHEGTLGEGTACYTDEAMTAPCADGDYKVDGKTYTVAGGKVSKVSEAENVTAEAALKLENDNLKAELEKVKGEVSAANTAKVEAEKIADESKKALEATNTQFTNLKKKFFDDKGEFKPEFEAVIGKDGDPPVETDPVKKLIAMRKAKAEANKK